MIECCPDCGSDDLSKRQYLYRYDKGPLYYCYNCGIKFNTPKYKEQA